jgi:type II secretory ATPase GspE/PulE/Tfp pilus assembly ATPase PilB-like protein
MSETEASFIKKRSAEGRERYLDMVKRERAMLLRQGINRSTEQLLDAAGAVSASLDTGDEGEDAIKDQATGDQLRSIIPVQTWLPLSIHLIGLENSVLKVAPLNELTQKQQDSLVATINRAGLSVKDVQTDVWDRGELLETLRNVHDLSADRAEKTLSEWLMDVDNGLLLNQFMRDLLAESLQLRASDIHIIQDNAPDAPNWIRYRIDGDMLPMHLLPSDAMSRLTTLLKRESGMNFGDRTAPKDGRFAFQWQGRGVDVRVAAASHSQDGEKLTLRLLDRAALKGFDDLFRRHEDVGHYLEKILSPEIKGGGGLILLSGPTGSGKTTTLYACVQQIDRRRRHVLTIEDPIEYELRYATQWQIRSGMAGGEFSDMIRAAMRHDPDYIVIGEMRDMDTVETSLRAAESGHTVISTIHADTALQTFERLRSLMPAERERASTYTLAQQVRCILNQRLIKMLCQGCAHKVEAKEVVESDEVELLGIEPNTMVSQHNSAGCDLCARSGFMGRTLLLDALLITSAVNERDGIFNALMNNVNNLIHEDGVIFHSRKEGILDLMHSGSVDPRVALLHVQD